MSKKINWGTIIILTLGVIIGIIIGLLVARSPINFNAEINLSSLVAILALFIATVVVPFKINSHLSNRLNRKSILTNDIDELLDLINRMRAVYEDVYNSGEKIDKKDQRKLLSLTRTINNRIDSICDQVKDQDKLGDFRVEVSLFFNKNVLPAYTEKFLPGKTIEETDCINTVNETEVIVATLKKKRYSIYE